MYKILLLCIILIYTIGCSSTEDEYASVIFFIGDVKKNNTEIDIGEIIAENDILTTGDISSCDVKIGGSFIRIKEKSSLSISSLVNKNNIENTILGLNVGRLLCKTKKLLKSESFLVKTPTVVAGIRGTRFSVEADIKKTTRIKVFNGRVKAIKRIKKLEDKVEELLNKAPSLTENEKTVITEKDVKKTEKVVEKLIKEGAQRGVQIEVAKIVEKIKDYVVVSKKKIQKFNIEDFQNERKEIIAVQEQPKEVIKKIAKIIQSDKEKPEPEGILLITKYEIYFIKNGKKIWKGNIIKPPIKQEDKLYIASGDFVFCASVNGPVLWKKRIINDGDIQIKDNKLHVSSKGSIRKLNIKNGEELKI